MFARDESGALDTTEIRQARPALEDHSSFAVAFEKRLAEMKAVDDESLAPLNIDVPSAVATVLGSLPEIAAYREEMAGLLGLDQAKIEGLEEYAEAAAEAHSRWVMTMKPPPDIRALNAQAIKMRELIRSDAVALARRNLISPEQVAAFKGYVGYKNVGFELIDWANLMRDSWSNIQGRTALTMEEVQNAKNLGERLVRAAGLREQAPVIQGEAARLRHQALTLLIAAYDETRRALGYLRWKEGDASSIARSLYAGRGRHSAEVVPPETPPEPQRYPPLPEPPAPPPVPSTSATPRQAWTGGAATGLAAFAQGLPGALPYESERGT